MSVNVVAHFHVNVREPTASWLIFFCGPIGRLVALGVGGACGHIYNIYRLSDSTHSKT